MGKTKKSTNELIKIRNKKRRIKRNVFFTVMSVVILIVLCLKLSYFNISSIQVMNNTLVTKDEIIELSNIHLGSNIFSLKKDAVRNNLLSNSYIQEVKITRKLPSIINIEVSEREPQYYIVKGKEYVIIDKNGIVLDIVGSLKGFKLVQISGITEEESSTGGLVSKEAKKIKQIETFTDLIDRGLSDIKITALDLSSNTDIKVYFNNIMVKVGGIEDMQDKLNRTINIITQQNIKDSKGYIDISFKGDPVMYIEK